MALKFKHHPGSGYHYVICDVCGRKLRAKDATLIKDKYNRLYGRLVCSKDIEKTNPQAYPLKTRHESVVDPKMVRTEPTPRQVFISNASEIENPVPGSVTGRLSGPPKLPTVIGATASSVELVWYGPDDPGSENHSGYLIERESPVGGGFSTLVTTTIPAMYYEDTSVSASTQYNYRISAVSSVGTGTASAAVSVTTGS